MSFREKNAWIAVITTLIVWGYYFWAVWAQVMTRSIDGPGLFTLFLIAMGITFVLLLGLNLFAAYVAKQKFGAPDDELERAVDARANGLGFRLLGWMLLGLAALGPTIVASYVRENFADDPAGVTAIIMANAILFVAVLSQIVGELVHIVSYRLMAAE